MINPEKKVFLIFAVVIVIIAGCLDAGATSKTYYNEDILNEDVKTIAIFPYRNTSNNRSESLFLNYKIEDALRKARPEIKFIDHKNRI